jgi:hypothetical protein
MRMLRGRFPAIEDAGKVLPSPAPSLPEEDRGIHARHSLDRHPAEVLAVLRRGAVLPAHPLALDEKRQLDRTRSGRCPGTTLTPAPAGLAVGVHATQFQIRDAGLYRPVLELAAETRRLDQTPAHHDRRRHRQDRPGRRGGAHGRGRSATTLCCWGSGALRGASEDELIAHCAAVAREMPTIGFYLQTAVGGIHLSRAFWTRFAGLDNVIAIKVAPFNRYKTLDVASAWLPLAPRSASPSTPATTTTSSPTW